MSERARLGLATYRLLVLRNLWRNPRRTLLTLLSLVLGIAALTLLAALNDGWLRQMRNNFILSLTGHVHVHAAGFEASRSLHLRIADIEPLRERIQAQPGVAAWVPRVSVSGLASLAGSSAGVQVLGLDARGESRVTHIREALKAGRWLRHGQPRDLLLGLTVAGNLGAAIGDRVVLTAQTVSGDMAAEVFYLRGILDSGAPRIDRTLALVNLAALQAWLGMGDAVTGLVIRTERHRDARAVAEALKADFVPLGLEVMGWRELDPMVGQWLKFSDAYGLILIAIVLLLVLVQALNTMLMAVHERTREIAIMSALGTRPRQLFHLVLGEALLLILLGALMGYAVGAAGVYWLAIEGIDLTRFSNAFRFFYMSPVIHPLLTWPSAARIVFATLLAALLAGLYPAWKARRISASEALRMK